MGRGVRELFVIVIAAGALTSLALGQLWVGLVLLVVALFIGRRLVRHGRIIGVDQRSADQAGQATVWGRARRFLRL